MALDLPREELLAHVAPNDPSRPMNLRRTEALRRLVRETDLRERHLVQPLFVVEDPADAGSIDSLPGQSRLTRDEVIDAARQAQSLRLGGVLLFGVPTQRPRSHRADPESNGAFLLEVIQAVKHAAPDLVLATDVCLCPYTHDGQCVVTSGEGDIELEATLAAYGRMSVAHARAGADIVAPSGMIDGTVRAVRASLDGAALASTPIMAYSAKYASSLYGPFRAAAGSASPHTDRRWHQMDPANAREALHEIALDLAQGADVVMVKPALHYLDVVARARDAFPRARIAAYHVSGEYAMLASAAQRGWIDLASALDETLLAIRRAGADLCITYGAVAWAQRRRKPEP
jgi:porphobilinogen synthase